jgi:hypothetical protein
MHFTERTHIKVSRYDFSGLGENHPSPKMAFIVKVRLYSVFLLSYFTFATVSMICVSAILLPMQDLAPIANGKEANGLDTPL